MCNVTFQMEINRTHTPPTHMDTTCSLPALCGTAVIAYYPTPTLPLSDRCVRLFGPTCFARLSDLHDPIDVYSEWIDQTEKANRPQDEAEDNIDEPSSNRERHRRERDDEEDDVGDDEPSRDRSRYGRKSIQGEEDEEDEEDDEERRRAKQRVKRESRVDDDVDEQEAEEQEAGDADDDY